MSSLLGNMTSWITGVPPDDGPSEKITIGKDGEPEIVPPSDQPSETDHVSDQKDSHSTETNEAAPNAEEGRTNKLSGIQEIDIDEMSEKALTAAKEWGSYLFNVGKAATKQVTQQVTQTAAQLKNTVEEKTFMGDFSKQQNEFVQANAEKRKKNEVSVPPWVGYNEEEAMKSQILALSSDRRNFMRNPPAGVQFNFDFEASFPVAMVMLQEDPKLKAMRFELVPKQLKEDVFWRNYFYRVSLIKQSAQLTSIAQQTGNTGETTKKTNNGPTDESEKETKTSKKTEASERLEEGEEMAVGSPAENEFISDAFQDSALDAKEIEDEMKQLGMSDNGEEESKKGDGIPEWEKELQAELQEYEVVNDGSQLDDEDIEQEILQQIQAEADQAS